MILTSILSSPTNQITFLVWFKRIQEDDTSRYIIVLDEPGLNLHATAQADLLNFIEELSDKYQIVYTTHSPFMIDSAHLDRVRTVVETNKGSVVSTSLQAKDPNTLSILNLSTQHFTNMQT